MKLTKEELIKLFDFLLDLGIQKDEVECVFLEGSYLYVQEPNDLDLVCVINRDHPFTKVPNGYFLTLRGMPADVNIISLKQYYNISTVWPFHFYHEELDWELLYGDPKKLKLVTIDESAMKLEADSFDAVLFHPDSPDYTPKRLVTFFVLARRLGHDIPQSLIEKAHREELDPQDFKMLFHNLFPNYSPKVHHDK